MGCRARMKIEHNIFLSVTEPKRACFRDAGVDLELGLKSFQIDEDDPRWPQVSALAVKFQAVDMAYTKFSALELAAAKHLGVMPTWHHQYPQPEENFEYLQATFDLSKY